MGKPGSWGFVFWFWLGFVLGFVEVGLGAVAGAEPMDGPAVMNPPDPPLEPEVVVVVGVFMIWFVF